MPHDAPPTILVTGKSGQVGFELRRSLAPLGRVIVCDRTQCDLADPDGLRRVVRDARPDVIINAAAYTAVDKAESDEATAFAINGIAPGILAEEAKALGAMLVHYSTDYVFDGTKASPYVETDETNPRSVYGKSKLAGERAVMAAGANVLVLRTCWVAGVHGANFAKTMLRLARERDALRVVADQFGVPTTAALIADVTAHIVRRHRSTPVVTGIYHLAAAGETNWRDYAAEVLRCAEALGVELRVQPDDVQAIASSEYPAPAPRPANSRLDTRKLRATFDVHLPDWRDGVRHLLESILA
ncbi:dTDP-4-dehydrorhamnose reductase [Paraburkholderia caffeinitolerans]|uniref:dTDP-4-dehydrorhamnose reductase n=1 Tax=Paraburkholderia caffeinitolerans TaxID=1723730 RepID=A0A6J5FBX2_9BURK|nr:dTDP-4-dehydrorhamnose reductase [Paraburkholderia caffeinitolerans]CAB3776310.1 dTDP-4-dehydrorhamnose reductase [Paraburkholderia caffeinitolerans]